MTWKQDVAAWLDGPMGRDTLRGKPVILAPTEPLAGWLPKWEKRAEFDLVTEATADDGTVHPAVILLTRLDDALGPIEDPKVATEFLESHLSIADLAALALVPATTVLWWTSEPGSPVAYAIEVRFPPGHNGDNQWREGGTLTADQARRISQQQG